ncbi:MAG: class I SAM-dependent methyltransferase [Planctomycetota bacterium]
MIPSDLNMMRFPGRSLSPGIPGEQYVGSDVPAARVDAFFDAGARHVSQLWDLLVRRLGEAPQPGRVLDFGCGVGRFTLALARRCREAIGVDTSADILRLARAHAEQRKVTNATFLHADHDLAGIEGAFDVVHSYTVFQHIRPAEGLLLLDRLVERLTPGGLASIHFTHSRHSQALRIGGGIPRIAPGGSSTQPRVWPMFHYPVDDVLAVFDRRGCDVLTKDPTDHAGHLGSMLIARRRGTPRPVDAGVYLSSES